MKIRAGFVSNSSSSSFMVLVALPQNLVITRESLREYFNKGPQAKFAAEEPLDIPEAAIERIVWQWTTPRKEVDFRSLAEVLKVDDNFTIFSFDCDTSDGIVGFFGDYPGDEEDQEAIDAFYDRQAEEVFVRVPHVFFYFDQ
jgi:hypothetical protein